MRVNRNDPSENRQQPRREHRAHNFVMTSNQYANTSSNRINRPSQQLKHHQNYQQRQQTSRLGIDGSSRFLKWGMLSILTVGFVAKAILDSYRNQHTSIRIFGPTVNTRDNLQPFDSLYNKEISHKFFSRTEQRNFLLSEQGRTCHEAINRNKFATDGTNFLVQRFDELPAQYGTELWKYCVLYTGVWNVYWQLDNLVPLKLIDDIFYIPSTDTQSDDEKNNKKKKWNIENANSNIAIQIDGTLSNFGRRDVPVDMDSGETLARFHHSFLKISKPKSKVALGMMRYLLDHDLSNPNNNLNPLYLDTLSLQQTLSMFVSNDKQKKRNSWQFWSAKCREANQYLYGPTQQQLTGMTTPLADAPCSAEAGEACCQVWTESLVSSTTSTSAPSLLIQHSNIIDIEETSKRSLNELPYLFASHDSSKIKELSDDEIGMSINHLPYIATVREYPTNAPPATTHETPNFFDILLRNNCLPQDKDCFKCLKLGYKEGDDGGDCTLCQDKCPCYCNALCKVRPPPKRMAAEWIVTSPRFRKDPDRIIPRVIHQTWYEPVTREKYPNMSRLIESFRKSGWEYEFYNDDKAAQFLSTHFPPAVREAYDSLIPGAFKADLFRYCVLLIRGGVYADMDILLESNLDESIPDDVGFLTSQDSPGETIHHRSCLWNGFMAVAPAHPVLAQTIQNVVNNIRNRFTSVDYDDMLCPDPILSVSHTVDTLFTCGPCILGASVNDVLKRHRQAGFDFGEIDIFSTEKQEANIISSNTPNQHYLSLVDPDDPRWLIPGKIVLLKQNKADMGSHRFTSTDKNLIVAVTDMPEYDDRPKSIEHYSKSHVKVGVYGLTKLYTNQNRANEEVLIRINGNPTIKNSHSPWLPS